MRAWRLRLSGRGFVCLAIAGSAVLVFLRPGLLPSAEQRDERPSGAAPAVPARGAAPAAGVAPANPSSCFTQGVISTPVPVSCLTLTALQNPVQVMHIANAFLPAGAGVAPPTDCTITAETPLGQIEVGAYPLGGLLGNPIEPYLVNGMKRQSALTCLGLTTPSGKAGLNGREGRQSTPDCCDAQATWACDV